MKKKLNVLTFSKVLLGLVFAVVFTFNLKMGVQKDEATGEITLSTLKTFAQSDGGELPPVTITCSGGTSGACMTATSTNTGYPTYESFCYCRATGNPADNCGYWDLLFCV